MRMNRLGSKYIDSLAGHKRGPSGPSTVPSHLTNFTPNLTHTLDDAQWHVQQNRDLGGGHVESLRKPWRGGKEDVRGLDVSVTSLISYATRRISRARDAIVLWVQSPSRYDEFFENDQKALKMEIFDPRLRYCKWLLKYGDGHGRGVIGSAYNIAREKFQGMGRRCHAADRERMKPPRPNRSTRLRIVRTQIRRYTPSVLSNRATVESELDLPERGQPTQRPKGMRGCRAVADKAGNRDVTLLPAIVLSSNTAASLFLFPPEFCLKTMKNRSTDLLATQDLEQSPPNHELSESHYHDIRRRFGVDIALGTQYLIASEWPSISCISTCNFDAKYARSTVCNSKDVGEHVVQGLVLYHWCIYSVFLTHTCRQRCYPIKLPAQDRLNDSRQQFWLDLLRYNYRACPSDPAAVATRYSELFHSFSTQTHGQDYPSYTPPVRSLKPQPSVVPLDLPVTRAIASVAILCSTLL
ncbi:hypothetical protein DFH06DRAFT_1376361 [Mycena polygramma]|nr:hypothetical protein DFH06DRAFT_1376361 [Mycena polygramma]